ncbi:MAG: hypothetical protein EKK40_01365 [Bradyrhizobiaceae bacterium]|nr:MAG: hypothetical protein EKK40_01365 [Bradyrhizobiaceae bacterium]
MSHWNERRIPDDICYLRQAHLFQKLGVAGLNTDARLDTDKYFRGMAEQLGHPEWATDHLYICHVYKSNAGKWVLQYPPGTGFLLAFFPEGFQAVPLYMICTGILFGIGLFGIYLAKDWGEVLAATVLGGFALYLMINPTKVSYSSAPTMVLTALTGLATARFFREADLRRIGASGILVAVLLGLMVNFRIPNLLLCAGYFSVFLFFFLKTRDIRVVLSGAVFAVFCLLGMSPTLIANTINAGSPFSTTYGNIDVVAPVFSPEIAWFYIFDNQGVLMIVSLIWMGWMLSSEPGPGTTRIVILTTVNLLVSAAFFFTHPISSAYYMMPVAMLSVWTLLFNRLIWSRKPVAAAI